MEKWMEELRNAGVHAWLVFVQSINGIAMAVVGGALVVHETYPDVIRGLLSKLPPVWAAVLLFVFGAVVHWGLRQAKKAN
jgi:hypothetical protein